MACNQRHQPFGSKISFGVIHGVRDTVRVEIDSVARRQRDAKLVIAGVWEQANRKASRLSIPSRLPVLYLLFAHASLLLAAVVVAVDPVSVTGHFYHPLMSGVVHLVTLGWISGSILSAVFIVGPSWLQMSMPIGRLDYWTFAFYAIGVTGIVSHFRIEQYSGMVWSAVMVVLAVLQVAWRVVCELFRAPIPRSVLLHMALACINLLAAGTLGVLIGADREVDVVPGSAIANVYAHAHLAGLGWATLMVMGVGHRLWTAVLPWATPPDGRGVVMSLLLVELGVVRLMATLLLNG